MPLTSPSETKKQCKMQAHGAKDLPALFKSLQRNSLPSLSYIPIIQLLTRTPSSLPLARQLHAHLTLLGHHPDPTIAARIAAMYSSSGDLPSASLLLTHTPSPSPLLYNALIRGHSLSASPQTALTVFHQMHTRGFPPDHFTFPFILKSCADIGALPLGRALHSQSLRLGLDKDRCVGSSLINMYAKCGEIKHAHHVFACMSVRDLPSWNALIDGYMKIGALKVAEKLFEEMPQRNIITWTAMISGYAQNGAADRALALFEEMWREGSGVKPTWVTVVSVLPACGHSSALEHGRRLHAYAKDMGFDVQRTVQIALVAMYAKCGSLQDARWCFDRIHASDKDVVAWNTIITAYTSHGRGAEAVSMFDEMVRSGVCPDEITFTTLLSACSHAGLVKQGLKYFDCMQTLYSVEPRSEHYACVVDLLGRAGRLAEAVNLIDQMKIVAGPSVWGALLSACRTHHNLEIGDMAAEKLFELEPDNCGNYVLLSNMYAEVGRWDEVDRLRERLKDKGIRKSPGCSWIEVNGKVSSFFGGDKSHPQSGEIYMLLEHLPKKIKASGYVPDTRFVLHDVTEEEKESTLTAHSEKLAVAFGLLNTSPGTVLRVTKNLRICGDCHMVIRFVSEIYEREIIVRDVNRFHHFKDGVCSCGDYW